jgi:hypothetical protein
MIARRELFAAHGVDLGISSWDETAKVIVDLFEQVPEALRRRFGFGSAGDPLPPR